MNEIFVRAGIAGLKALIAGWSREKQERLTVSLDEVERAISQHISYIENWSRQISIRDIPRSRSLSEVFVSLSLSEKPAGPGVDLVGPDHLLRSDYHSVLLGHPGAGKTTTIKYLCQHLLHEDPTEEDKLNFPLVVFLREIPVGLGLIDYLIEMLRIRITIPEPAEIAVRNATEEGEKEDSDDVQPDAAGADNRDGSKSKRIYVQEPLDVRMEKEGILTQYLNSARVLLLLDGLDEVRLEQTSIILQDIMRLVNLLTTAKIVLTSRIGVLDRSIDNSEILYACPFNQRQTRTFAARWLGSEQAAELFLDAVEKSPYRDTVGRPLILVNLCMVFQTYGELPDPPSLIYQKVVQLLLEDWDRQRDLRRASSYARFGPDRKRQFLGAIAYQLATYYGASTKYHVGELKGAYRHVCSAFGLPIEDRERVMAEIESHTGLFVRTGFNQFEFSHKSLQEYLCADHITRLPRLDKEIMRLRELPNECAIATVLSASPNALFELLVFSGSREQSNPDRDEAAVGIPLGFWNPYMTRLIGEGASFAPDPMFGVAILTLASYAWCRIGEEGHRFTRTEGGTILVESIEELLQQKTVADSVCAATKLYYREARGEESVMIRVKAIMAAQLPDGAPDALVIDKRLIQGQTC